MQHLSGIRPCGEQRMVAEHMGVAVGGCLLGLAVHLGDRRVDVDGHGGLPWSSPAAQARASTASARRSSWRTCPKVNERRNVGERGRRHDPVPEHLGAGGAAQHIGVVDRVAAGHDRMQRHHFPAGSGGPGPDPEVEHLIGPFHVFDPFSQFSEELGFGGSRLS